MGKLRALFHPIMVFIGVQIAWIVLMAVWINWYLENNLAIKEFAQKIRSPVLIIMLFLQPPDFYHFTKFEA
jgi:hypothetical protein